VNGPSVLDFGPLVQFQTPDLSEGADKNVAARTENIAWGENPDFVEHCGRSFFYVLAEGFKNVILSKSFLHRFSRRL
jgi:hypothetical protein